MAGDRLPAGPFGAWLDGIEASWQAGAEVDVPCGSCTACCESGYFVHVEPDEVEALARIPAELLVPAEWKGQDHQMMGFDEQGRCPMLVEGGCSIYEHRPRTCRTYDCRVFPAAGVVPDDKPLVAERVGRWRFTYEAPDDEARHATVRAAAEELGGRDSASPTEMAVRAVAVVLRPSHEPAPERGAKPTPLSGAGSNGGLSG